MSGSKHHRSHRRSSNESGSETKRVLRKAVEQRMVSMRGLQAAQLQVLNLFPRVQRMRESIDDAFGGQPFLPGIPPDAALNIHRWNTYFKQHAQVTTLQRRAVELWQLACGLKQKTIGFPS
jgi:hypothetical protein